MMPTEIDEYKIVFNDYFQNRHYKTTCIEHLIEFLLLIMFTRPYVYIIVEGVYNGNKESDTLLTKFGPHTAESSTLKAMNIAGVFGNRHSRLRYT